MGRYTLSGIRLADLVTLAIVIAVMELDVTVGGGSGAAPLTAEAYILGALITLPLLLHRRWPLPVLWATFALMIAYYLVDRRNISPAPLMAVPVYDAALAGYLAWAIAMPMVIMTLGVLVVGVFGSESTVVVLANFLPGFAIFIMAVALGEVVRGRRALAAETERRLRLADDDRRSQAARLLAEERLRIARELHDTVAHSMATITVQAGSALHLLAAENPDETTADGAKLREALSAIRDTGKEALGDMRSVLGQLREEGPVPVADAPGLDRLPGLRAAVTAAGSPVTVTVEGEPVPLAPAADHAAYRILQESLTNVLRHTPPGTPAAVRLRYGTGALTLTVTDESAGPGPRGPEGNGIRGMRERAASVGGSLDTGLGSAGGFAVTAVIPGNGAAS